MRTPKVLHPKERIIYKPELSTCPHCGGPLMLCNYLTGALFILIALQAKALAPYVLILIPASYAFGLLVSPPVAQAAQFNGKYFVMVYFAVCVGMGGVGDCCAKKAAAGCCVTKKHILIACPTAFFGV